MNRRSNGYLSRRILSVVPVWLGLSLLSFSLANLAPGDPAQLLLQQQTGEPPSADAVAAMRADMGLDRPFAVRYVSWLGHALKGDLGASYSSGVPVVAILARSFPNTLELALASLVLGVIIAIPLGMLAALRRGAALDHFSRLLSLAGTSVPSFVMGYLLMLLFGVTLRILPVSGSGGIAHLILPAATLGLAEGAALARLVRASMLEVLGDEYIVVARAKGVPRYAVLFRHALRNALNPVVTMTGLRFGRLLGGAIIVEIVFGRMGIGSVILDAIHNRDYAVIQGFILFIGSVFVGTNLAVDFLYSQIDPRVRAGRGDHHELGSARA